ncbi:hypothetical protein MIND_00683400 [Mycena indigotica]|uniref:Uncharacterized protein n=1 Tax=Mycena indigotica TaxID=2126181 RepID=A0A8H6SKU2_9AGAR|nr:uncharacterized protein MIND_00683400 [Mycena indigotica]KAF7301189.1 hypothetical protein MIND_00683400 [Mycena indigotica]
MSETSQPEPPMQPEPPEGPTSTSSTSRPASPLMPALTDNLDTISVQRSHIIWVFLIVQGLLVTLVVTSANSTSPVILFITTLITLWVGEAGFDFTIHEVNRKFHTPASWNSVQHAVIFSLCEIGSQVASLHQKEVAVMNSATIGGLMASLSLVLPPLLLWSSSGVCEHLRMHPMAGFSGMTFLHLFHGTVTLLIIAIIPAHFIIFRLYGLFLLAVPLIWMAAQAKQLKEIALAVVRSPFDLGNILRVLTYTVITCSKAGVTTLVSSYVVGAIRDIAKNKIAELETITLLAPALLRCLALHLIRLPWLWNKDPEAGIAMFYTVFKTIECTMIVLPSTAFLGGLFSHQSHMMVFKVNICLILFLAIALLVIICLSPHRHINQAAAVLLCMLYFFFVRVVREGSA